MRAGLTQSPACDIPHVDAKGKMKWRVSEDERPSKKVRDLQDRTATLKELTH